MQLQQSLRLSALWETEADMVELLAFNFAVM
jgi:hypothetical protein